MGQERRQRRKAAKAARRRKENAGLTPVDNANGGAYGRRGGPARGFHHENAVGVGDAGGNRSAGAAEGDAAATQEVKEEAIAYHSPEGGGGEEERGSGEVPVQEDVEEGGGERLGIEEGEEEWFLMAGTWLSRWHAYVLSGKFIVVVVVVVSELHSLLPLLFVFGVRMGRFWFLFDLVSE